MRNHLRTVPVSPERRQVEMKHEPGARGTEDSSPPVAHAPDSPPRSVPKVGLEPTPSCEDRILSPARLPFRHFGRSDEFASGTRRRQDLRPGSFLPRERALETTKATDMGAGQ